MFSVKEGEMKGIFLLFHREVLVIEEYDIDQVGVKIETSEGVITKSFNIRWMR